MTTIRPADELGPVLAGRSQATVLRALVERLAREEGHVTVDFAGVLTASPSFADELFAKLDRSLIDCGIVSFEHLPSSLAAIARFVRAGRPAPL